ncbi:MAG: biopolymer transporter ExbD [Myxococcota bacterium]
MGFDVGPQKGGVRPTINVTPLVDVVLVLLIIFLVVTPMLTKQFSIAVPPLETEAAPNTQSDDQVVLRLDAAGALTINAQPIAIDDLDLKLRRIFAVMDPDVVFFDAAAEAPFGQAVKVMDIARGAGAVTVGIVTEALVPEKQP